MKIAIINDVHVGKDLVKDGSVRASSSKALEGLERVLTSLKKHDLDAIIDLGDLVRSESAQEDSINYKKAIKLFQGISLPRIHLLGNHEVKQLASDDIQKIWQENGIPQKTLGCQEIKGINFIWLDFEQEKSEQGIVTKLSQQSIENLDNSLNESSKPAIILSHYVLTDQNLDGNFLFQKPLNIFSDYANKHEILEILKKHGQVLAVFSAHTHGLNFKCVNELPHITLPAMVENIAAPETNDNFPEIYTLVNIENEAITVKCFSREYCFATLELDLKKPN